MLLDRQAIAGCAVIVHLNWVCIFLGFHSFGLSLGLRWVVSRHLLDAIDSQAATRSRLVPLPCPCPESGVVRGDEGYLPGT